MKLKNIIFILSFLLIIKSIYGLDCQYKDYLEVEEEISYLYLNNNKIGLPVTIVETDMKRTYSGIMFSRYRYSISLHNSIEHDLKITLRYIYDGQLKENKDILIKGNGIRTISFETRDRNALRFDTIEIIYNEYEDFYGKFEKTIFDELICKRCPRNSDLICVDDGKPADSDERCGSGKRDINGICTSGTRYIVGDGICSIEVNENCAVSPIDCACGNHTYCNTMGVCVDNPNDPPDGMDYCNKIDAFRRIGIKTNNLPCDCDFECVDNFLCISNKCQPNPNRPPKGKLYCGDVNNFKKTNNLDIGDICDCDFECIDSVCFNNVCQNLISPKITCPSGKSVKRGEEISCNIVGDNTKLNQDVKVTFILEAGHGLSFSESLGCQNIKGSQCIGTYTIADLSNEGVEVKLTALTGGDTKISGKVIFQYKNQSINENVESLEIHKYFCGDGKVDVGETKENCCLDVGVEEYNFFKFYNEVCEDGNYKKSINLYLITIIAFISFILIILVILTSTKKEYRKIY